MPLCIYLFLFHFVSFSYGIGFEIPPGLTLPLCFYEHVEEENLIKVMFQVTHGGNLDVNVQFAAPDGKIYYQGQGDVTGRYTFNAHTTGLYAFCFGNEMSRVTAKTVQLEVSTYTKYKDKGNQTVLKNQVKNLQDATELISADYQYLKQREIMHVATNESTNKMVFYWSLVEMFVLISMGCFQIFFLKRFFENSRTV